MKEKQAPKIEIDKHAIRFTFSNGNGLNLLWRDLFCPKNHHQSFQDNILFAIERCFRVRGRGKGSFNYHP